MEKRHCSQFLKVKNPILSPILVKKKNIVPVLRKKKEGSRLSMQNILNSSSYEHIKSFNFDDKEEMHVNLYNELANFIKKIEKIDNVEAKFQQELKFYTDLLIQISIFLKPFDKIVQKISENLKVYLNSNLLKNENYYKAHNDKVLSKLKNLSEENIDLFKKNEELKDEINLIKKTIQYNEGYYNIDSLLKELHIKSQYISKCNSELQEYRAREYQLLRKLEKTESLKRSPSKQSEILNNSVDKSFSRNPSEFQF